MKMPTKRSPSVVVVGAGVAGSAVALALCHRGLNVTLLCRAVEEGSSFTNQKWHHSGLLYPSKLIAQTACRGFLSKSQLGKFIHETSSRAKFLALHQTTLDEREQMWQEWGVPTWGLKWRSLDLDEYRIAGLVGTTRAIGGFCVPDRVVDFPRLVGYIREEVLRHGGTVIPGTTVSRIRSEANCVAAVDLLRDGQRFSIDCSLCVVAAGAWTNRLLEESEIAKPDLILRKCVVLEYQEELVSGLTSCLDVSAFDGTIRDVTLIPFRGKTLAAGTGFTEVSTSDDDEPDPVQIERLNHEIAQCFPEIPNWRPRIVTCTKTEQRSTGRSNVQPQVYGHRFHGITGLAVAIPGKASFMFDLPTLVLQEFDLEDKLP